MTFSGKVVVDCQTPAILNPDKPIQFDITVANNAAVPFLGGHVRITLSDNLCFVNLQNGQYVYLKDANGQDVKAQETPISDERGSEITVQPGYTVTIPILLAATKTGTVKITIDMLGFDPRTRQWDVLSTKTKSVNVLGNSGK